MLELRWWLPICMAIGMLTSATRSLCGFTGERASGLPHLTGDLIHADPPIQDNSLPIILDILKLRAIYAEAIIYLCGNHELPHIYGFGLSRGKREYTPAFEAH